MSSAQMFFYDTYQSLRAREDFDLFSLEDVDAAFSQFTQVKYAQHIVLPNTGGIQVTAYAAGRMLGGAVWKITKVRGEGEC